MRSPEQMGEMPETPETAREESVEDKKETPEKPKSPEHYDEAKWEELKKVGAAFAINKGKEMGVPQEELDRFMRDVIARETENQDYGFVYRFMKSMDVGTKEELKAVGEKAYRSYLESGNFRSAMVIAEEVYGKDSEEWRRANEEIGAERKKTRERGKKEEEGIEEEERELRITLPEDSTFADLFDAIDAIEEKRGLGEVHFEEELWDNFDPKIVEKILSLRHTQPEKTASAKIIDFFEEQGYTLSDVSALLPIKFRRERKRKL